MLRISVASFLIVQVTILGGKILFMTQIMEDIALRLFPEDHQPANGFMTLKTSISWQCHGRNVIIAQWAFSGTEMSF